jgi:hypothetical protein
LSTDWLKNKVGCQKFAFALPHDVSDDLFVQLRLFGGNQGSNGKNPQGVGYVNSGYSPMGKGFGPLSVVTQTGESTSWRGPSHT